MAPSPESQPSGSSLKRNHDDSAGDRTATPSLEDELPYDPSLEEPPNSVMLSPEWRTLSEGILFIKKLVTDPFKESDYTDMRTKAMGEWAAENMVNPKQEDVVVCISGDMGAGKSATLNSLFNVGAIAREGAGPSSTTLACNRFAGIRSGQEQPFLAEVSYFSPQDRREILAGYLKAWYQAAHGAEELAEEEEEAKGTRGLDDQEPTEENVAIQTEVEQTFFSLFRDKIECCTEEDVTIFLECAKSEDDPDMLRTIYAWSDELVQGETGDGFTTTVTASTARDLKMRLEKYTLQAEDLDDSREPALSPLVCLITFHFDDPMTRNGVTWLDTPGFSDLVRTRRLSAVQYSGTRTHVLIVCEAVRVLSNSAVLSELKSMRTLGPDRTVIVTTKTDKFKSDETSKDEKNPGLTKLRSDILSYKASLVTKKGAIRSCDPQDDKELNRLRDEQKLLEIQVKLSENAMLRFRIEARNHRIRTGFQKVIRTSKLNEQAGKPVQVFGISNHDYATHLDGFESLCRPALSVEGTQIPALRRLVSMFPNVARLHEILHAFKITIPSHLHRLDLYTSTTPIERNAEMQIYISKAQEKIGPEIRAIYEVFAGKLNENVVLPLEREGIDYGTQAGSECSKLFSDFSTGKFMALMNRSGHRRGTAANGRKPAVRTVDVTATLISIKMGVIANYFAAASPNQIGFEQTMIENIESIFSAMVRGFKEDQNFSSVDLKGYLEYLHVEKPRLRRAVVKSAARILHGLDDILRKAAYASDDAYIAVAMLPIYEQVRMIKAAPRRRGAPRGTAAKPPLGGYPMQRKRIFKQECTRPNGIWSALCNGIKTDIANLLEVEEARLQEEVGAVFKDFAEAFETRCDVETRSSPGEKRLQETLSRNLVLASEHLRGPMQEAADSLVKNFPKT